MKLRELGVEFSKSRDRRSVGYVRAIIASRFELAGAENPFFERRQFVGIDRRTRGRVWAHQRRMRDWNSLLLKSSPRILNSTPHPGISLAERYRGEQEQRRTDNRVKSEPSILPHTTSPFFMDSVDGSSNRGPPGREENADRVGSLQPSSASN
jgi:hypothetical protein